MGIFHLMNISITDSHYRDQLYEKSFKAQQKAQSLRKSSYDLHVSSQNLILEANKLIKSFSDEFGIPNVSESREISSPPK